MKNDLLLGSRVKEQTRTIEIGDALCYMNNEIEMFLTACQEQGSPVRGITVKTARDGSHLDTTVHFRKTTKKQKD